MDCVVCGARARIDPLCETHKRLLSTTDDLTPEQIREQPRSRTETIAWLVDMFGGLHPIFDGMTIGRDPMRAELAILHASVSSVHARVLAGDQGPTIEDCGSLNGTQVDGKQAVGRVTVPTDPALICIGSVSLLLTREPSSEVGADSPVRRTVPQTERGGQVILPLLSGELSLIVGAEGAELTGAGTAVTLSAMEGRLLRALMERAAEPIYTPSAELVASLGFGTPSADGDNVRELVARLRRKLAKAGLSGLIESRARSGYRLAPAMLRRD